MEFKSNSVKLLETLKTKFEYLTPVDWAEKNYYLTQQVSRWPGYVDYSRTPYMKEVINCAMPDNPAQVVSIKKSSQMGFSIVGIFAILGWIMDQSPANTLFITETDQKIKDQMQGPISNMINSSGLAEKVGNHNIRERSAKGRRKSATGDTDAGINFGDGRLYTWSGQNIGKLSSWSIKYGIYDEVERYKLSDKQAGNFYRMIEMRHKFFKDDKKMFFISTPEIKQMSRIEPLYLMGDQRKYHIPCKCCGEYIDLKWSCDPEHLKGKCGIVYTRDTQGFFDRSSVKYRCQKCGEKFNQTHVYDCYDKDLGKWIPTAEPKDSTYRSYHISSLYSPVGADDWTVLVRKWCEIHPLNGAPNLDDLKTFFNQDLGECWDAPGLNVNMKHIMNNIRHYDVGVVPNALSEQDGNGKIIILTCAIDLNGFVNDGRLDYEVVGWSESGSSYMVDYGSIGSFKNSSATRHMKKEEKELYESTRKKLGYDIKQPENCFTEFEKFIMSKFYISDDDSRTYQIVMHGLDTGHFTVNAYAFADKHTNIVKLKGKQNNEFTRINTTKYYYQQSSKVNKLYHVEGDIIKNDLYQLLQMEWSEETGNEQPEGYLNFPRPSKTHDLMKDYIKHYDGEKKEPKLNAAGTAEAFRWVKKHTTSPNHMWDNRVYNMCVKQIFTEFVCKSLKIPVSWTNLINVLKPQS